MSGWALDVRTERLVALALIGFSLAVTLPKVRPTAWGSANTKSRLAVVEALVHHGTFAINDSPFHKTMDRIKIGDKLYSSKPPLLPTMIAGVYFVLHHTLGLDLREERKENPAHIVLALLFGGGSLLMLLLFGWGLIQRLTDDSVARLFALGALGLAEYGAGYAVDITNHLPAAAIGMGALYFAARIAERGAASPTWHFAALGGAVGLLPTVDLPSALLSMAVGVWMLRVDLRRTLQVLVPVALLPIGLHLFLTYQIMDGFLPAQMRGDVWEKHGVGNTRDGWFLYTWNMSFGHHGVVAMVPLLIPSGLGIYRVIRAPDGDCRWLRQLAVIVGSVGLIMFFFYSVRTKNYGGVCFGFRWLIPAIAWTLPFIAVFLARHVHALSARWMVLLPFFFAVGFSQMAGAARNPWATSTWQETLAELAQRAQREGKSEPPPPAKRPPPKPAQAKPPSPSSSPPPSPSPSPSHSATDRSSSPPAETPPPSPP